MRLWPSRNMLFLCSLFAADIASQCPLTAHAQARIGLKERHDLIVSMAHDLIYHQPQLLVDATRPKFYVCRNGHLHWSEGSSGINGEIFPMQERLQLEWFWKHLDSSERRFWKPYLHRVDELIIQFMRESEQRQLSTDEESRFYEAASAIYEQGANDYARMRGVKAVYDSDPVCCAAFMAEIVITTRTKNVTAIEWMSAGTLWESLSTTGHEPAFQTLTPGTSMEVAAGGMYYYRLIMRNGRQSKLLLAPTIGENTSRLVLPWR